MPSLRPLWFSDPSGAVSRFDLFDVDADHALRVDPESWFVSEENALASSGSKKKRKSKAGSSSDAPADTPAEVAPEPAP